MVLEEKLDAFEPEKHAAALVASAQLQKQTETHLDDAVRVAPVA